MEKNFWTGCQPGVVFLLDAAVVKDHMDLLVLGHLSHYLIHKSKKFDPLLQLCGLCMDSHGGHLLGRKRFKVPWRLEVLLKPRVILPL